MAKKRYDVVVGQKYKSGNEEKTRWVNIGVILQNDKGFSLKLESIPVNWDGWASLFEPKDDKKPAPRGRTPGEDDDGDVPW